MTLKAYRILVVALPLLFGVTPANARESACAITADPGASLSEAKTLFSAHCPEHVRQDCDVINNAWTCSAGVIGSHAPAVVELGLTDSSAADGLCYSPAGNNLRHARDLFSQHCSSYTRRDCDPVGMGWRCSSGVIGSTAPSVSSQPTSTEQADSDPTIVKEPRTAQPAAEQTEVEQTAIEQPEPAQLQIVASEPAKTDPLQAPVPVAVASGTGAGRLGNNDLLVLHYDNCPDPDDGHAMAAALSVVRTLGLADPLVVNGTCGHNLLNRFEQDSVALASTIWNGQALDAHNNRGAALETSINRWAETLANGADVWVAEGGPSDFTTAVLRGLSSRFPGLDLKRVHVVQHAIPFNEGQTSDIGFVKRTTSYINVPNGNVANGSAQLRMQSNDFVTRARASRDQTAWNAAFRFLPPTCKPVTETCKLDFSDTVELLYIVGDSTTRDVTDFADRYFR